MNLPTNKGMPKLTGDIDKFDRFLKQFKQRCPQSYSDIVAFRCDKQLLTLTWRELPSRFAIGIAEQVWSGKVEHTVIDSQFVADTAAAVIVQTMEAGQAKHGNTWQSRDDREDLQHAMNHITKLLAGDTTEQHMEHALTRLALVLARKKGITS